MVDGAASLAFYMLFSLIPMLLIFGALINILGADAAHDLVDLADDEGASASLEGALEGALDTAVKSAPRARARSGSSASSPSSTGHLAASRRRVVRSTSSQAATCSHARCCGG